MKRINKRELQFHDFIDYSCRLRLALLQFYRNVKSFTRIFMFTGEYCQRKKYSERMISICEPFIPKDFVKMN